MKTEGHFVCKCVNTVRWSATETFSVNCLRSLPAFACCFLELNDVYWVLRSTNVFLKVSRHFLGWKGVYCSLAVALERTVFPFVKQYIEDRMAAECCYDLTFRAHFLSSRKRYQTIILYIFNSYQQFNSNPILPWHCTFTGHQMFAKYFLEEFYLY